MKDFFKQLIVRILSYIVFITGLFFILACLITGEFPPKMETLQAQYQTLLQLKTNSMNVLKMAAERLKQPETTPDSPPQTPNTQKNESKISASDLNEIRVEQQQIKAQINLVIQQNNDILKLLTDSKKK